MVAPYPYARWPRIGHSDVRRLREQLRTVPDGDAAACRALAERLFGAAAGYAPEPARIVADDVLARALDAPFVALVFERDDAGKAAGCVLELGADLAAAAVGRALGIADEAAPVGEQVLDEIATGALGYLGARLADAYGDEMRLAAVTTDARAVREALGPGSPLLVEARIALGASSGRARWWVGKGGPASSRAPSPMRVQALGRVELSLTARIATLVLTRAELESLGPGDVVVPDRVSLARGPRGWYGTADLQVDGARRTRWRCRAEQAMLTVEAVEIDEELAMTEGTKGNGQPAHDALTLATDAPVEIAVEIARFTLPLAELSRLRPGEVLSTGRTIGDEVALRAGGRAIAKGELVDVDGEVGVRVTEIGK